MFLLIESLIDYCYSFFITRLLLFFDYLLSYCETADYHNYSDCLDDYRERCRKSLSAITLKVIIQEVDEAAKEIIESALLQHYDWCIKKCLFLFPLNPLSLGPTFFEN
jgi:hypothetical protein